MELMVRRHHQSVPIHLKYQEELDSYENDPGQNGLPWDEVNSFGYRHLSINWMANIRRMIKYDHLSGDFLMSMTRTCEAFLISTTVGDLSLLYTPTELPL